MVGPGSGARGGEGVRAGGRGSLLLLRVSDAPSPPFQALLHVLFEHASGYGLFALQKAEEVSLLLPQVEESVLSLPRFLALVRLVAFAPFRSAQAALDNIHAVSEGQPRPPPPPATPPRDPPPQPPHATPAPPPQPPTRSSTPAPPPSPQPPPHKTSFSSPPPRTPPRGPAAPAGDPPAGQEEEGPAGRQRCQDRRRHPGGAGLPLPDGRARRRDHQRSAGEGRGEGEGGAAPPSASPPRALTPSLSPSFPPPGIRLHFCHLIKGLTAPSASKAQLGLGHSYSRAKVKFNVNRVDNMIIQSISLLDQLDKDINTFSMRVRWALTPHPRLGREETPPPHLSVLTAGSFLQLLTAQE